MTVLNPAPAVPNGVYRIKSVARSVPDLYLECSADNEIRPVELQSDSDAQKWRISVQANGTYSITNVGTLLALSITTYQEDGKTKQRAYGGGAQSWILEPRGGDFVIGIPDSGNCLDLAINNWTIVWERNNAQNQHWILDSVDPIPIPVNLIPGVYRIRNRMTNSALCIWTDRAKNPAAPVLIYEFLRLNTANIARDWTLRVSDTKELTLTNAYPSMDRYLTDGPFVTASPNIIRLIPVAGTQYFHIATNKAVDSPVIVDFNPRDAVDQPASTSTYSKDDMRQHWEFMIFP